MYLPNISFDAILSWLLSSGLKIILILAAAFVVTKILRGVVRNLLSHIIERALNGLADKKHKGKEAEEERLATLEKVIISVSKTVVWVVAVITVLPELGINIGPLLAGLGVAGLALGFGAKTLIQDYISGVFILMEDQFRVGEKVEAAGIKGKVKSFNLRRTALEDEEGNLCYIPNNQIKRAVNFSRK